MTMPGSTSLSPEQIAAMRAAAEAKKAAGQKLTVEPGKAQVVLPSKVPAKQAPTTSGNQSAISATGQLLTALDNLATQGETPHSQAYNDAMGILNSAAAAQKSYQSGSWLDQVKQTIGNWTPVQRLYNDVKPVVQAVGSAYGKYLDWMWSAGGLVPRGPEFRSEVLGKSLSDFGKVSSDILWDLTGGLVQNTVRSFTTQGGKALPLQDVLPGATAFAQLNPSWGAAYKAADQTTWGKAFSDIYLTAQQLATGAAIGGELTAARYPSAWNAVKIAQTGKIPANPEMTSYLKMLTSKSTLSAAKVGATAVGAWWLQHVMRGYAKQSAAGAESAANAAWEYNRLTGELVTEAQKANAKPSGDTTIQVPQQAPPAVNVTVQQPESESGGLISDLQNKIKDLIAGQQQSQANQDSLLAAFLGYMMAPKAKEGNITVEPSSSPPITVVTGGGGTAPAPSVVQVTTPAAKEPKKHKRKKKQKRKQNNVKVRVQHQPKGNPPKGTQVDNAAPEPTE